MCERRQWLVRPVRMRHCELVTTYDILWLQRHLYCDRMVHVHNRNPRSKAVTPVTKLYKYRKDIPCPYNGGARESMGSHQIRVAQVLVARVRWSRLLVRVHRGGIRRFRSGPGSDGQCEDGTPNICIGSAVNIKSGNLYFTQGAAGLTLTYNSIDPYNGPMGKKWTHSYDLRLTPLSDNSTVKLKSSDGNIVYFRLSNGVYYPEAISGYTSRIVKNQDGSYTQTAKNGLVYQFNSAGRLTSISDRNGNMTTLTYNGNDLAGITNPSGRTTTITTARRPDNLAYRSGRKDLQLGLYQRPPRFPYRSIGQCLAVHLRRHREDAHQARSRRPYGDLHLRHTGPTR